MRGAVRADGEPYRPLTRASSIRLFGEWIRKDLSICIADARRNGSNLRLTALSTVLPEVEKMAPALDTST